MKAFSAFVLLGMLFLLPGCSAKDAGPEVPSDVKVENVRAMRKADGSSFITGIVRNTSDRPYSLIHIEFNCYDNKDNFVGAATTYDSNLQGHGSWIFTVAMPQGATQYKLNRIKGSH